MRTGFPIVVRDDRAALLHGALPVDFRQANAGDMQPGPIAAMPGAAGRTRPSAVHSLAPTRLRRSTPSRCIIPRVAVPQKPYDGTSSRRKRQGQGAGGRHHGLHHSHSATAPTRYATGFFAVTFPPIRTKSRHPLRSLVYKTLPKGIVSASALFLKP